MTNPVAANAYAVSVGSAPNVAMVPFVTTGVPASTNIKGPYGPFKIGQNWVDQTGQAVYTLVALTSSSGAVNATWALSAGGTGSIATLTGDSGGLISPVAGNISILGGTGVSVAGTPGTLTINLTGGGVAIDSFAPDAGTNPVVPNGAGLVTMAGTANQITTTGGLNTLTFSVPSAFIAPGSIASTTSLTAGSGFTVSAGAVAVTTGTSAINISADAAATTINLGTGAGVKTLTLGSTTTTSVSTLQSGSGGISITAANGALAIASGTGAMSISADAAATTVGIATGAAVKTLTLGSTNSTSATTVQSGSGALNITSTNGAMTLASGTGALSISADAAATTVLVATGAGVKTASFGSTNSTSITTIDCGTGGISVGASANAHASTFGSTTTTSATTVQSGSGALNVTSTGGALTINSGVGALAISNDAAVTTVTVGTGAAAKTTTLGSTNSTSTTTVQAGSGGITLTGAVTSANAITVTSGDITATLGNVILNGAAKQLRVHGGAATDFIGQATLTNGTVTVSNTNIAATDRVFVNRSAKNGSTAYGVPLITITASTNFVLTACKSDTTTETGDASTFDYFIVRQV